MPLGKSKKTKRPKVVLCRRTADDAPIDDPIMDDDGMINEDAVLGRAVSTLHRLRLSIPKRPVDNRGHDVEIDFPPDLTLLTNDELGTLHSQLSALIGYIWPQVALLDSRHTVTKDNEKTMRVVQEIRGEARAIKQREKDSVINQASRERALVHHTRVAEYKLLSAVLEGYVHKHKTVSREFARRGLDLPSGRSP